MKRRSEKYFEEKGPIELSCIPEVKDGLEEDLSETDGKPSSSNDTESVCEICRKSALMNRPSNLSRSMSHSNITQETATSTETNSI